MKYSSWCFFCVLWRWFPFIAWNLIFSYIWKQQS